MLIGWLREEKEGCRIAGRAGSDINGMLYLCLIAALLLISGVGLFHQGQMNLPAGIVFSLCAIGIFLLLVSASRDRDSGLALVNFLELSVGSRAQHEFL